MKITVLGSGTSAGIPLIGCRCAVCTSSDPRDNRLRPSVAVSYNGRNVVIDTPPDFRTQVLRAGLERLDAVLYTHAHADHIMGLDDVRPFNFKQKTRIPIYGSADTMTKLQQVFHYVFHERARLTFVPQLDVHILNGEPVDLFGLAFQPIPVIHGDTPIFGYRFGAAAYLTDHSEIPAASMEMLRGLDVLFLDALRHTPHPTHSTVETSIANVRALAPKRAFFTHMCHDLGHAETQRALPPGIQIAYDGLEIDVD